MKFNPVIIGLTGLVSMTRADPTWPSDIDELEEIMFQLTSFRARKFSDTVSPCNNEASGPGRQNAAEWLRTAFHDMSTANDYFHIGGLDGSLQYELTNGENTGPGHQTTLEFLSPFVSSKSSLSDLIAMGVYTSVRSCGGPAVPIRAGRVDAAKKGSTGVPQPQNSIQTFEDQFDRMGFTVEEMIQVTACGHTLGGVHTAEFPEIAPADSPDGEAGLDSSVAAFDNKVVTEYLAGTTTNPLVVGQSVSNGKNSDFRVFNADNNVTMQAMADKTTFNSVCKTVLQKMIDVVPSGVTLGDPIQPFMVKPVALQLTLINGGSTLQFTGYIRVKTTDMASEDDIDSVTLDYKNRNGGSSCGSGGCKISLEAQGVGRGFDDSFAFFPINYNIGAATGISSFTVTVTMKDGTETVYDNNGEEYPIQDAVLLQVPQSCVLGSSGSLTVTAAVLNTRVDQGVTSLVSYKVAQTTSPKSPIPKLKSATITLEQGDCVGAYTLFSATYTIPGDYPYQTYIDVINGDKSDSFKSVVDLGGLCQEFSNPGTCGVSSPPDAGSSSSPASSSTVKASASISTAKASSTSVSATSTTFSTATKTTSKTSTSTKAAPTLSHRDTVGEYELVSCWVDNNKNKRALTGSSMVDADMTLEMCMEHCSDYVYWATEFGQECYCGNELSASSAEADMSDCSMTCGGDDTEYCGAGNRLELYSTTAAQPAPTATLVHQATVSPFTLVGCWTEASSGRALSQKSTSGSDMTNEKCAKTCSGFKYFGSEFGGECYCGNTYADSSSSAPLDDCDTPCTGNPYAYCGGSGRLELYMNPDAKGGATEQPAVAGDYTWYGCQTDQSVGARTLGGKMTASDDMTNEFCADFCADDDYELFGTEYGRECYCGNSIGDASTEAPSSECNMLCAADTDEFCGAGNRLSVYKKTPAAVASIVP